MGLNVNGPPKYFFTEYCKTSNVILRLGENKVFFSERRKKEKNGEKAIQVIIVIQ